MLWKEWNKIDELDNKRQNLKKNSKLDHFIWTWSKESQSPMSFQMQLL
jgi:hypothetical protein